MFSHLIKTRRQFKLYNYKKKPYNNLPRLCFHNTQFVFSKDISKIQTKILSLENFANIFKHPHVNM